MLHAEDLSKTGTLRLLHAGDCNKTGTQWPPNHPSGRRYTGICNNSDYNKIKNNKKKEIERRMAITSTVTNLKYEQYHLNSIFIYSWLYLTLFTIFDFRMRAIINKKKFMLKWFAKTTHIVVYSSSEASYMCLYSFELIYLNNLSIVAATILIYVFLEKYSSPSLPTPQASQWKLVS